MTNTTKIGLGGGCHWCTEAVFQPLKGVKQVSQGYIASTSTAASFSEGVIVEYDPEIIPLEVIIEIHLHTHRSTSNHSFREKYRSAVYYMDPVDEEKAETILENLQPYFKEKLITQVLPFREFEVSRESLQDYYLKNPDKPFCRRYIDPKLDLLREKFSENLN